MWMGDTLRSTLIDRSMGRPSTRPGSIGTAFAENIGNNAQPVALVEYPRLARDVRSRIMQPEIAFQPAARGLRNHLARPVMLEAIDHHTVEAGQAAHFAGRDPVEGPQVRRLLQGARSSRAPGPPN